MDKTDLLDEILRRWGQIKQHWNDKKSKQIEQNYLEPLEDYTRAIRGKVSEVYSFITSIENRLNQIENI